MRKKIYGLYDMKYHEQCIYIGTTQEIASFLNIDIGSLYCHVSRKKSGKAKYLQKRYELIEVEES